MSKLTLTNPTELKALLQSFDIDLKYSFGQNFLISKQIIDKIIKLSESCSNDRVLEIGPGAGTLTVALLESGAKVESVEIDNSLYKVLEFTTQSYRNNFTLIPGDALHLDISALPFTPNKLIANLPYNIAATLILDLFQKLPSLNSATVMVQKEVADRICAKSNTKLYGAYTIKLAFFAQCFDSFFVSRNNFMPAPRVDSAVIRLDRIATTLSDRQIKIACTVADAAFHNRRKTIYNSMVTYFGKEFATSIKTWFENCNVDAKVRAECLEVDVFKTLAVNAPDFMA